MVACIDLRNTCSIRLCCVVYFNTALNKKANPQSNSYTTMHVYSIRIRLKADFV